MTQVMKRYTEYYINDFLNTLVTEKKRFLVKGDLVLNSILLQM